VRQFIIIMRVKLQLEPHKLIIIIRLDLSQLQLEPHQVIIIMRLELSQL